MLEELRQLQEAKDGLQEQLQHQKQIGAAESEIKKELAKLKVLTVSKLRLLYRNVRLVS